MSDSDRWIEFMRCVSGDCETFVIVPWAFRASISAILCAACAHDLTEQDYERIVIATAGE